jgi:ketosteroid isomerase-like protein
MKEVLTVSDETKVAVLQQLVDAFNRRDVEAAVALFSNEAVFDSSRGPDPWGRRFRGKVEIREGIRGRFEALPQGRYHDDSHFVCGDRGFSEYMLDATTAAGVEVRVHGCDIWTFEGDRIVRKNSFWKIVEK